MKLSFLSPKASDILIKKLSEQFCECVLYTTTSLQLASRGTATINLASELLLRRRPQRISNGARAPGEEEFSNSKFGED